MAEELLESEAIEEPLPEGHPNGNGATRLLPVLASRAGSMTLWRDEVKVALAAGAGIVAGAAAVAVVRAGRGAPGRWGGGLGLRRREPPQRVVASRSFLVDIHLLGNK